MRRDDLFATIRRVGAFNHDVLYLGRRTPPRGGFGTEYDIQRSLLAEWSKTPLGHNYPLVEDEFPVDGGANPRRIDILAKNDDRNEVLAVEIKRAEADSGAIEQITGYLNALRRRFEGYRLVGALVAERIPESVRSSAREANIIAFEIDYPLVLKQVV